MIGVWFFLVLLAQSGPNGTCHDDAEIHSDEPVDFLYEAGQMDVDIPFALNGACGGGPVFTVPELGVKIEDVVLDGESLSPMKTEGIAHDRRLWKLSHVGRGFQYRMSLWKLESKVQESFPTGGISGLVFRVPRKPLPKRVSITYRIRCPDGRVGDAMVTRGLIVPSPDGTVPALEGGRSRRSRDAPSSKPSRPKKKP